MRSVRGWLDSHAVDKTQGSQPPPGLTGRDGFEQHCWKLFLSTQGYMRNPPRNSGTGTPGGYAWVRLRRAGSDRGRCRRAAERLCVLTRHRLRPLDIAAVVGMSPQVMSEIRVPPDTPMSGAERRKHLTALSAVRDDWIETYWYSVDPVQEQVGRAIKIGDERGVWVLAGGEVAADVWRPWLMPTRGLVYAEELIDLADCNLVEVAADDATLTLRVPSDPTIWATAAWWRRVTRGEHGDIATVDPVVVLEDLATGTAAGDGGRERLIDWIVGR